MTQKPEDSGITVAWLVCYLVAVVVVGVGAGVVFFTHDVGGQGQLGRLLLMLLAGEAMGYLIVLIAPGERVVPYGRAFLGVAFAMVARLLLAFFTAMAVRLSDPSAATLELLGEAYATRWAVALAHIVLMVLYLWLVRAALETEKLKAPVEAARRRARRQEAEGEQAAEERRQRLLNVLMDREEPTATPPAEGKREEHLELLTPEPRPEVAHPVREPSFTEVLTGVARDEVELVEAGLPPPEAPTGPAEAPAPKPPVGLVHEPSFTEVLAGLGGEESASEGEAAEGPGVEQTPQSQPEPPRLVRAPMLLPLDDEEGDAGGDTVAFMPVSHPGVVTAAAGNVELEIEPEPEPVEEPPAEAGEPPHRHEEHLELLTREPETDIVHPVREASFTEVLTGLARDEVELTEAELPPAEAEEPPAQPEAPVAETQEETPPHRHSEHLELLTREPEADIVHPVREASFTELLTGLAQDEVELTEAELPPAEAEAPVEEVAEAPLSEAARATREALAGLAPGMEVATGAEDRPVAGAVAPTRPASEAVAATLRASLAGIAGALAVTRSGDLESLLAICGRGACGITAAPEGLGAAAVAVVMPGEAQLGVAALQLRQVRRGLGELSLPAGEVAGVDLAPAGPAEDELPAAAARAREAIGELVARRGEGLVLVSPGAAEAGQVAAAAERLWADCAGLATAAELGALSRVLLTGSAGGLVVGTLGEGLLVAMVAPTPAEVAKLQVQVRRLQAADGSGSEG